eukprot:scaffold3504_cov240-Pinguiococcus_pyrenoidosus.AAC.13
MESVSAVTIGMRRAEHCFLLPCKRVSSPHAVSRDTPTVNGAILSGKTAASAVLEELESRALVKELVKALRVLALWTWGHDTREAGHEPHVVSLWRHGILRSVTRCLVPLRPLRSTYRKRTTSSTAVVTIAPLAS